MSGGPLTHELLLLRTQKHVMAHQAMTCCAQRQGAHHDTGEVDGGAGVEDEEHGGGCEGPEQGDEPRRHQHAGDVQVGEV